MKSIFLSFILLFFVGPLPMGMAARKMGTESGGGGGVVWLSPSRPVLMDYFTFLDSLEKIPVSTGSPSHIPSLETPLKKTTAWDKAVNILGPWQDLPYDIMSLEVLSSFESIAWNFTDLPLVAPPFYLSPHLPKDAAIEVVAYYSFDPQKKKTTVEILRPLWNQMSLNDQAGLLIHEALRHVQIGIGNGYSDEVLQRATAIYLMCRPKARLNYYIQYLLLNYPEASDRIYGPFEAFIAQECGRLP